MPRWGRYGIHGRGDPPFLWLNDENGKKVGPAPPRAPFCVCLRSVALPIGGPRAGPGLSAWQMAEPPPVCQSFYLTALKRRAGPLVPRVPGYLAAAVIKLGGEVRRLGERRTEPRGRTNEPSRPRKNLRKHTPATTERPSQKAPSYLAAQSGGGRRAPLCRRAPMAEKAPPFFACPVFVCVCPLLPPALCSGGVFLH